MMAGIGVSKVGKFWSRKQEAERPKLLAFCFNPSGVYAALP
jgi:hypothetical protein